MISGQLIFAVFIVLQLADGLITYEAVRLFGPLAEGNPLLAMLIVTVGAGPTLLGAKLLACGCAAVLYGCGARRSLAGLTALYLFRAIGPWLHLLSDGPF
jgi:hypothetical protein